MADYGYYLLAGAVAEPCGRRRGLGARPVHPAASARRQRLARAAGTGHHTVGETLVPDAMLINRDDEIVYAKMPAALKPLGATAAHQVIGRAPLDFVHVDGICLAVHERIQRRDEG